MISYHIPEGFKPVTLQDRTVLSTPSGGRIIIDSTLLTIWQEAHGNVDEEIVKYRSFKSLNPKLVLVALACLSEAGLLCRQENRLPRRSLEFDRKPLTDPGESSAKVSAIIVCHNSRLWLEKCISSLLAQTYSPLEIIVIDNGSSDGSTNWLAEAFSSVKLVTLDKPQPLARALNLGIETAEGVYYLLLNPDVELEPDALAGMLAIAQGNPSCAAVSAKLRFSWAPAFLNGLGNFVGAFSWGTDCALGHLDLGQFDAWYEIPSACFAATLIPSVVYKKVGPIDEGYPLYYEDSDWSYRSRLLGFKILVAPKAIAYHAFGGQLPDSNQSRMTQSKLRQVSFGRLRFATKILGWKYLLRFLSGYFIEDVFRAGLALLQGSWGKIRAILQAWNDYFRCLPALIQIRYNIQAHRIYPDEDLLRLQRTTPMPLIWRGYPCLTWNIICNLYLPLLISGRTREVPEISKADLRASIESANARPISGFSHIRQVWRAEGFRASLYWIGKSVQWLLMQP